MGDNAEKKSFMNRLKESQEAIKTSAKNKKIPSVKIPEIKMPSVKELFKKKPSEIKEEVPFQISSISTQSALKVIYYLIGADGQFLAPEIERFDLIGQELHPEYAELKGKILEECQGQMDKIIDPDDFYDVIQDGIETALLSSVKTDDTFITPKLLVWDLLTIAYSDGGYDDIERRLIKYVVRKLDIDKAVFLEMESSIQTLMDLEREQKWLKTTDRPYLTIESMVNEIEDRKRVVFDSIKDLISL